MDLSLDTLKEGKQDWDPRGLRGAEGSSDDQSHKLSKSFI